MHQKCLAQCFYCGRVDHKIWEQFSSYYYHCLFKKTNRKWGQQEQGWEGHMFRLEWMDFIKGLTQQRVGLPGRPFLPLSSPVASPLAILQNEGPSFGSLYWLFLTSTVISLLVFPHDIVLLCLFQTKGSWYYGKKVSFSVMLQTLLRLLSFSEAQFPSL